MTKYIAIDYETTSLDWKKANLIGVGHYCKEDLTIGFGKELPKNINDYECIYHNGPYDIKVARKLGVTLRYDHDTLLMASLLQYEDCIRTGSSGDYNMEESLKLDALAKREFNIDGWKIDWKRDRPSYADIQKHCLMDCKVTYFLFHNYMKKLKEKGLWDYYYNYLMPLARACIEIECRGIRIDVPRLLDMKIKYKNDLDAKIIKFNEDNKVIIEKVVTALKERQLIKVKEPISTTYYKNIKTGTPISVNRYTKLKNKDNYEIVGGINPKETESYNKRCDKIRTEVLLFNPNSYIHVGRLLDVLGIKIYDKFGDSSTSAKLLYTFRNIDTIEQLLDYKKLNKLYKDFLCRWDKDRVNDIIYASINLANARTGRLSYSEPNLQQVPKESDIRTLFIPREGKIFTIIDASQIEARLAAYMAKETKLIEAFKAGIDPYDMISKDIGANDRAIGKQVFLASIYGQGADTLYHLLNKEKGINITETQCQTAKDAFKQTYPNIGRLDHSLAETASLKGFVETLMGRRIFIPQQQTYKAINNRIQGTACELEHSVIPMLQEELKGLGDILLLVHDEVVIEHLPEDTDKVKDIAIKWLITYNNEKYNMFLDAKVGTGANWGVKA